MDREVIAAKILEIAGERGRGKTLCPSEAARQLAEEWSALMPQVHDVARTLESSGKIEFLQRGQLVKPGDVNGPYRIRIKTYNKDSALL